MREFNNVPHGVENGIRKVNEVSNVPQDVLKADEFGRIIDEKRGVNDEKF